MATTLGLDVGTNSVGSAWVDADKKEIQVGVSVFSAGVRETKLGDRGAPKNQERRAQRSARRSLARRSARKRKLRRFLTQQGLLPSSHEALKTLFQSDPWELRKRGLDQPLAAHEFGRVLVHLCQRRGALGLALPENGETSGGNSPEGEVKAAIGAARKEMAARSARTFGELMAMLAVERCVPLVDANGQPRINAAREVRLYRDNIRNRRDSFEFHADRDMLRDEFNLLWQKQAAFTSDIAAKLTPEIRLALDNPLGDRIWRHRGLLFGQRRTYWNAGTLGRCALEPTDRCVPIADRHASYFRVVETVNNIRLRGPADADFRPLTAAERQRVIVRLQSQKSGTIAAIRQALGIDKKSLKKADFGESSYALNLERDEDREINTDWFYSEVVRGAVGEHVWQAWDETSRERLNRAILRFDPALEDDSSRLRRTATALGLDEEAQERLLDAWRKRPKLEKRLNLSRRAVRNLLPYMEAVREDGHWLTQIEARRRFAEDPKSRDQSTGSSPTDDQRARYALGGNRANRRDRHYLKRHPDQVLPPAPTIANPVVRKAIHEIRRHVIAHIRAHGGRKPDRIVIEFAREVTKSARASNEILARNRHREQIRRRIREEIVRVAFGARFDFLTPNQLRAAEDRVILCEQQKGACAYSVGGSEGDKTMSRGRVITLNEAALGREVEIDHIVPYSRSGDNSLNNKVLCFRDANRNKGNHTPREWWGCQFDERIAPLRFMDGYRPVRTDYFTLRDYAAKWHNLGCQNVPSAWKASQLSDTAYAARQVQLYLQQSLWPDEPTHLSEGSTRRVFASKGAYTARLRRDWQLYQHAGTGQLAIEEQEMGARKNRGDHREHAIDAVVIALTDSRCLQEVAAIIRQQDETRIRYKTRGAEPEKLKRAPVKPPWGSVQSFRHQVLSLLYPSFTGSQEPSTGDAVPPPLVVSNRGNGRKLIGAFHEDMPLGPVLTDKTLFTARKPVEALKPGHLRMPIPEKAADARVRLAARLQNQGVERKLARKQAKEMVASRGYVPKLVDPPPQKSGLVRDSDTRRMLREAIEKGLAALSIPRTADDFTENDLKRILKERGPLRTTSGVPIKRVVLLRTMNDPIVVPRKRYDEAAGRWTVDTSPRAARAYQGGNNHHIEIREDERGNWHGYVVSAYDAAVRARCQQRDPVDRNDDIERGGRFMMSLAKDETVYMRHKLTAVPDYFVVFKIEKTNTIHFRHHWDARRAKGEKADGAGPIPDSQREEIDVTASQLKGLAPPGEQTPIKMHVDPLGRVYRLEPLPAVTDDDQSIDPRVMAIAREAITARAVRQAAGSGRAKGPQPGSWSWMRDRLRKEELAPLEKQLWAAIRLLTRPPQPIG